MTFFDTTADRKTLTGSAVLTILTAPFRAIARGLVALAEADSRMQEVRRLQKMSDADLAAAGTDRAREVQRIFSSAGAV